jgi:hypothetical protein
VTTDFNELWKFEALKIAAMEQLDMAGKLNIEKLFIRAKDIFEKGYEHDIQDWKSSWPEDNKPVKEKKIDKPKETKTISIIAPNSKTKICPKCGEDNIPIGWKMHQYKKNGEPCGFTF